LLSSPVRIKRKAGSSRRLFIELVKEEKSEGDTMEQVWKAVERSFVIELGISHRRVSSTSPFTLSKTECSKQACLAVKTQGKALNASAWDNETGPGWVTHTFWFDFEA